MKILIVGTGVIDTIYGWQLLEAGCDLTHLVYKDKRDFLEQNGIKINCMDTRRKKTNTINKLYRPKFVDNLTLEKGIRK